jgi:hypothetical protein
LWVRSAMRRAVVVTVVFLLLAVVLLFVGVARVTADVNAASGDVRAVFGILGMPIVIGLKQAGHRRLEFGWGTLVLLIVPFLIGQAWAMWHIMKRRPALT